MVSSFVSEFRVVEFSQVGTDQQPKLNTQTRNLKPETETRNRNPEHETETRNTTSMSLEPRILDQSSHYPLDLDPLGRLDEDGFELWIGRLEANEFGSGKTSSPSHNFHQSRYHHLAVLRRLLR